MSRLHGATLAKGGFVCKVSYGIRRLLVLTTGRSSLHNSLAIPSYWKEEPANSRFPTEMPDGNSAWGIAM